MSRRHRLLQNKEEFFDDWRFAKVWTGNMKSNLVSEFRRILERLPKEVAFPPSTYPN